MTLKKWLEKSRMRQAKFARAIGATPGLVSSYIGGAIWPSFAKFRRIYRVTNGEVTPNDFFFERKKKD